MTNPKAGRPDMVDHIADAGKMVGRLRSRKGEAITRTERLMNDAADLIVSLQSQLEAAESQRDALAKVIDPDDNRPALMARIIMASTERLVRAETAERERDAMREALERSMTALDDWLNDYAHDFCKADRVAEARDRIYSVGTIAYIAHVQEANRKALQPQGDK